MMIIGASSLQLGLWLDNSRSLRWVSRVTVWRNSWPTNNAIFSISWNNQTLTWNFTYSELKRQHQNKMHPFRRFPDLSKLCTHERVCCAAEVLAFIVEKIRNNSSHVSTRYVSIIRIACSRPNTYRVRQDYAIYRRWIVLLSDVTSCCHCWCFITRPHNM